MTTFVSGAASSAILLLAAPDSNRIVQGDCKYSDVHKMTYCETTEIFWRWELQSDHSSHLFTAKVDMLSLPHSAFTQGQSVVRLGSLQLVHVRVEWSLWERWGKEGIAIFFRRLRTPLLVSVLTPHMNECDTTDRNGCTKSWNNYEEPDGARCRTTAVSAEQIQCSHSFLISCG